MIFVCVQDFVYRHRLCQSEANWSQINMKRIRRWKNQRLNQEPFTRVHSLYWGNKMAAEEREDIGAVLSIFSLLST